MSTKTGLRIGFISTMHYPAHPPFRGGAEATSYFTTELLAKYGHQVYLFQRGKIAPPGVENIQFDAPTMFDEEHLLAGAILRFAEAEKIDILINTSWIDSFPPANLMGYGPPMLFWLPLPYGSFPAFDANLQRYSSWGITRYSLYAQTNSQARPYLKNDIPIQPLRIPVPLGQYAYGPEAIQKADHYYVWAGRPTFEKAPDRAIEFAVANYGSIFLYGSRETDLWSQLQEEYKDHASVFFQLDATPEDICGMMYGARATLFLNRDIDARGVAWHEPGSRVIMESLLQGCPVIGTKNGCLNDWIDEDNGFLLDQHYDEHDMREAFRAMQGLQRRWIQQRALGEWSEEAHYRRLMDAITQNLR